MAAVLSVYGEAIQSAFTGLIDWDTNAIKMMLCTGAGGAFNEDHDDITDISDEHAAANGYATGGATLGSKTQAYAAGVTTFGSASVVWAATGALTAKYAVCYDSITGALIFHINLDGAGGDVTATDANFTITNASGYFSIDVSP